MQFIQGNNRHQTYFTTPDEQVSADNAARLMDAFVDKLNLQKLGFTGTVHKTEGRPPYTPARTFKIISVWLFKQNTQQPQTGAGVQPQH
jgi:transposase